MYFIIKTRRQKAEDNDPPYGAGVFVLGTHCPKNHRFVSNKLPKDKMHFQEIMAHNKTGRDFNTKMH